MHKTIFLHEITHWPIEYTHVIIIPKSQANAHNTNSHNHWEYSRYEQNMWWHNVFKLRLCS